MYAGIDLGGTKTIGVILDNKNQIILRHREKTDYKDPVAFLLDFYQTLAGKNKIKSLGISIAGWLDPEREKIIGSPNLPVLNGLNLKAKLKLNIPFCIENDVNCFTYAESLMGAAKNKEIVVGITLGTGVGGGLVFKKQLFTGAFGSALEVGQMVIRAGGVKEKNIPRGSLEAYTSGKFFLRESGKNAKTVEDLARDGNKNALRVYRTFGNWLGIGLANVINIIDPHVIVLGGGIANAWQFFYPSMKQIINKNVVSKLSRKNVQITKAALGFESPAIGAALLAKKAVS